MPTVSDLGFAIARSEILVSQLGPHVSREDVLQLLACLDQVADLYRDLAEQGGDLRAEATRIETVQRTLAEHGRQVAKVVGRSDQWSRLRASVLPDKSAWWWRLDQQVTRQSRARLLSVGRWALAAVLMVVAAIYVYARYLGPDTEALQKAKYLAKADQCVRQGELECALEQARQALVLAPDDPEINLKVAVLLEAAGQLTEVDAAYTRAASLYQDRALFHAMRGQEYISLGWLARAVSDAGAAIAVNDQLALSWCTLGGAYEGQGNLEGAAAAFERCAGLAFTNQQDELYVLASSRLALLLRAR